MLLVQAEEDGGRSSEDGGAEGPAEKAAGKEKMPNIPKTEPSSPRKASAEKPAKGGKAPGGKKASGEKAGKAKAGAKAAKDAAADGKPKKERKVYELPGQTRDTPLEVSRIPMVIVMYPVLHSMFLQVLIWITCSTYMDNLALSTVPVC